MKRSCTESEERIIRTLVSEVLPDQAVADKNIKYTAPVILGFLLGFGPGILIAYTLRNQIMWVERIGGKTAASFTFTFVVGLSAFLGMNLCTLFWAILRARKSGNITKKHLSASGSFQINGGTVLQFVQDREQGSCWIFAEDDLLDPYGIPYMLRCPVYGQGPIRPGDRIMLIYCSTGDYIPMRIDGHTSRMIPPESSSYFDKIDWNSCICLPHPNAAVIDQTDVRVPQGEAIKLNKTLRRSGFLHVIKIAASGLMSLFLLIPFAVLFCILILSGAIRSDTSALIAIIAMIPAWIFLSYKIIKRSFDAEKKQDEIPLYRKKVLFWERITEITSYDSVESYISVYEFESGMIKTIKYPVLVNNASLLPKNLRRGTVIYKYHNDNKNQVPFFAPANE